MSDQATSEGGFLSLADLASLVTDEITTLTSRLPEEGIYTVRGTEVTAAQAESVEGKPPLFRFNFQSEVLEMKPLDSKVDPEKFVGRSLRESYTLWPADFKEAIGLLKGRFQLIGLENKGNLGGVEGQAPGWLDNFVNKVFKVRVRHYTDKNKNERAGFDWLKPEVTEETEEAAA